MATSPSPIVYHSVIGDMTELGLSIPTGFQTPSQRNSTESMLPLVHYLYLCINAEGDYPLPPALFNPDMILGMCLSSAGDAPQEVLVYSCTIHYCKYIRC